jgi:hypothetical protein
MASWSIKLIVAGSLLWSIGSSLMVYPHNLAYFNELVGGPKGGPSHLLSSNVDWGQDLLFLRAWLDDHPEARPIYLAFAGLEQPEHFGIEYKTLTTCRGLLDGQAHNGWYAISVNNLYDEVGNYR